MRQQLEALSGRKPSCRTPSLIIFVEKKLRNEIISHPKYYYANIDAADKIRRGGRSWLDYPG